MVYFNFSRVDDLYEIKLYTSTYKADSGSIIFIVLLKFKDPSSQLVIHMRVKGNLPVLVMHIGFASRSNLYPDDLNVQEVII